MKLLLALAGLVLVVSYGVVADKALADKMKPFEQFSPYEWTKWLELRPPQGHQHPQPMAAAAIAYVPSPYGYQAARQPPQSSDETDEIDDDEEDSTESLNPFDQWFKRAILPPVPAKKTKADKKLKDVNATKKPSIVEVPLDFWGPPPSVAPNVTLPPPPGYWAAKKSMFVSKLFAALASAVLNTTGPPPLNSVLPTTTVSPRQAILDEIESVLLSDYTRSVAPEASVEDSEEEPDTEEAEDEVAEEATTVNPFLLGRIDFLEKLTAAILAQPKTAPAPIPATPRPTTPVPTTTTTTTPKPKWTKPVKGGKAGKGKKVKPTKAPKYLKYIPTTTTTTTPVPPPTIDYEALAKALLGNKK